MELGEIVEVEKLTRCLIVKINLDDGRTAKVFFYDEEISQFYQEMGEDPEKLIGKRCFWQEENLKPILKKNKPHPHRVGEGV